jgi:hypothetical protein
MTYQYNMAGTASLISVTIPAYNGALRAKIGELDLGDKVEVVNDVVDTSKSISESHIIVVPSLNTRRTPEILLQAIDSVACGRSVVSTDMAEIAHMLLSHKCGCVSGLQG